MTTHTELAAQQDAFERVFPMPQQCTRHAGGYSATAYNAWAAQSYCDKWAGWRACAAALESTERLAGGGEPVGEPSPTAGMNIAQRILHVGGRNNAAGYVEFGSIQAVQALVRQVLRDLPQAERVPLSDEQTKDAARWKQVREHWKNARFTFRKTPKNTVKTITLLIDFDHATTCGANELEREFDEARAHGITPKEGA